jgi:N-acetylglutamate synthase/N-acetylornithine aminotransferase
LETSYHAYTIDASQSVNIFIATMSDSADLKQQLESERQKRIELEQQLKNLLNHLNEGNILE